MPLSCQIDSESASNTTVLSNFPQEHLTFDRSAIHDSSHLANVDV